MPAPARPHFPPLSTFRAEITPPGPVPRGFLRGETWPPARPWPGRAGASGASGARVVARLPPPQADPPFEDRSAGSTPILRIAVSHFASSASPKTSSGSEGQVSQPLA